MPTRRLLLPLLVVLMAPACAVFGYSGGDTPLRSPTLDYPLPPAETSDGQVLGADGMRVEDKLRTSPRLGSEGAQPAEVPSLIEERRPAPVKPADDSFCLALGVDAAVRHERCRASVLPRP